MPRNPASVEPNHPLVRVQGGVAHSFVANWAEFARPHQQAPVAQSGPLGGSVFSVVVVVVGTSVCQYYWLVYCKLNTEKYIPKKVINENKWK
jgi:hypothetical protein